MRDSAAKGTGAHTEEVKEVKEDEEEIDLVDLDKQDGVVTDSGMETFGESDVDLDSVG